MLTHKNIVSNVIAAQTIIEVFESDIVLSILPIPHVLECTAGFLIPIFNGASINYIEKPPTPRILIDAFSKVRPTFMVSVPLIIEKIFKNKVHPNFTKNKFIATLYKIPAIRKKLHKIAGKKLKKTFGGRLRFFGIGGAKLSAQVESFLSEADFPFTIGYGLTETAPILAGSLPQNRKARSTGPIMEGVEIKLDKNKQILAKGPNVMKGYYKDPERTAEVFKDGWFCTGDLGHIDEDGYLFIVGRSKSVIVGASGENIYPEQIELMINDYEFVVDSLVYQEDDRLYARINLDYEQLDIKFEADKNPDSVMEQKIVELLENIRLDLNKNVSSFSRVMKFVEQREPFIKTATKKIKRYLYTDV
jgi:long-chain acyl-CoA synthetase